MNNTNLAPNIPPPLPRPPSSSSYSFQHHQQQQQQQHLIPLNTNTNTSTKSKILPSKASSSNSQIKITRIKLSPPFDFVRLKRISKLSKKIRSIETFKSLELKKRISLLTRRQNQHIFKLREMKLIELNECSSRYSSIISDFKNETFNKKRLLREYCIKELQRIKNRIQNNKKISAQFNIYSISSPHDNSLLIKINRRVKYSNTDISCDISSIFRDWSSSINFNNKRITRAQSAHSIKKCIKYNNNNNNNSNYDINRIKFHLNENQVKNDLKYLLNEEQKKIESGELNELNEINDNKLNIINYEDFLDEANLYSHHGFNSHNHITITQRWGPLNDPQIIDPIGGGCTRRRRRIIRHNNNNNNDYDNDNTIMYHSQDVQFVDNNTNTNNNNNKNNNNNIQCPSGEEYNLLRIDNFTILHGELVRINYLSTNTTIDARVVSIKKTQLSAQSITSSKRKRVWYKDLRIGKINIVPPRAYQ